VYPRGTAGINASTPATKARTMIKLFIFGDCH
jgi:hypothetical protein